MIEPNNDEVICPECCHQFRAIPVNIQHELTTANERISELEAGLAAEREVLLAEQALSDKLEKALKVAKAFCDGLTAEECPDTVALPISAALAEVGRPA